MRILVFGGTGFVGLNIAATLLARGHAVTLFDRAGLPPAAAKDFASHADRLTTIQGDIRDKQAIEQVIAAGYDAIILGAAITAGPEREATDPETILAGQSAGSDAGPDRGAARWRQAHHQFVVRGGLRRQRVPECGARRGNRLRSGFALRHHQARVRKGRRAPGRALAIRHHQRAAERRVRAVGAQQRRARHAKPAGANSVRTGSGPRGRSVASGRAETGSMPWMSRKR